MNRKSGYNSAKEKRIEGQLSSAEGKRGSSTVLGDLAVNAATNRLIFSTEETFG